MPHASPAPDAPIPSLTQSLSQRIALARVLCIFGMIYVHVPSVDSDWVVYAVDATAPFESLRGLLVEGFGRASASLLSLVSGYLSARVLSRGTMTPSAFFQRRFGSIFVPMVIWGTLTLLIYAVVSLVRPTFLTSEVGDTGAMLLQYLNSVFFITDMPVGPTMHLGFLRDLFVCMLLAPVLLMLLQRAAPAVLLACLAVYLLDVETVIILRPLILLGFVVGLWLFVARVDLQRADRLWWLWLMLAVLSTLLLLFYNAGSMQRLDQLFAARGFDAKESLLYPLSRLFGSLAIWTLTLPLVASRAGRWAAGLTPYAFVTYCSHYVVLTLVFFGLWQPLVDRGAGNWFFLWFLAGPAVAYLMGWLIVQLLALVLPQFTTVLTGGRTVHSVFRRSSVVDGRGA